MKNGAETRCLKIGEEGVSEAQECGAGCSWLQVVSEDDVKEILERNGLLPPIAHRYDKRPVFHEWDDSKIYVRTRPVFMDDGRMHSAGLSIYMKKGMLITVTDSEEVQRMLKEVEKELRGNKNIRKKGCEGLFMMLIRSMMDSIYEHLESLGVRIDRTEMKITSNPGENALPGLHAMRKDLMVIRRQIWSLRSFSDALSRSEQMGRGAQKEAMEIHEESLHLMEISESYREMLSSLTDIYVSSLSYRTNEIMKVLTIIATIFIPLTFITGLYGMNFNTHSSPYNMPELNWYWGYPATLLIMLIIGVIMLLYFRKERWI